MKRAAYFQLIIATGLMALGTGYCPANPAGGQVAAGAASINTVPGTVTINQASNTAIINWQSFSIGAGELTKFVQPSVTSAALNRVLGGQTSIINGTLSANGQVYLINGNGILVGPGGIINTAGFTGSTRNISDADFLSGNLHFTGSSSAGVQNLGTINAIGGDVYLIGHTVDNQGTINAASGTAGLVAADDILLAQKNADGSTITVNPSPSPSTTSGKLTGVHNSGAIKAASAELKAANGNIYALAINNEGTIRATTVKQDGGHIFLVSDTGTVKNSGTLDASATAAGGKGGSVSLINMGGTAISSGNILATGGRGGAGGKIETSGKSVQIGGTVDAGKDGVWVIDPANFVVDNSNVGTYETALNLGTNTAVISGTGIDINVPISWTTSATLQLTASTVININQAVTGTSGTLSISAGGIISDTGAIAVANFILQGGQWAQVISSLPAFNVTGDFEIQGGSFLRATSGDGSGPSTPYVITDVFGLQGVASLPLSNSYALGNNIDATTTANWHSGAGFMPIGSSGAPYTGVFNGVGYSIDGLYINLPSSNSVGLFGSIGSNSIITSLGLTNIQVTGYSDVGGLVGWLQVGNGAILDCFTTGSVTGTSGGYAIGGLVGANDDIITGCYSTASVNASASTEIGGLVGYNYSSTSITDSFSTGTVTAGSGTLYVGGLVGQNVGGGSIVNTYSTSRVNGTGSTDVGGLIGNNAGTIAYSFWDTNTAGVIYGVGSDTSNTTPGVTGATTAQLMSQSFFVNNAPTWDFTSVWSTNGDTTTPQIIGLPVTGITGGSSGSSSSPGTMLLDTTLAAFGAYTANGTTTQPQLNFSPNTGGLDLVSVDNPNSDGGAINNGGGSGDTGGNIASGSSTSGSHSSGPPTPSKDVTPGSGISSIFGGGVSVVKPPPIVMQQLNDILNYDTQNSLHDAAFNSGH